jgi:hypothetical protein
MLRTEKIRRPDLIVQCGPNLIEKHRSKVCRREWGGGSRGMILETVVPVPECGEISAGSTTK